MVLRLPSRAARRAKLLRNQPFAQAKLALSAAEEECKQLESDVAYIRRQMAAPLADVPPEATQAMAQLEAATRAAVKCLEAHGHAAPEHVGQAIQHSQSLVMGFRESLAHAMQVATVADGKPVTRLEGKQPLVPPPPPSEPAHTRVTGKQAEKRNLIDLFGCPTIKKQSCHGPQGEVRSSQATFNPY